MLLPARLNSLLLHDSDGSRANHGTLLFLALLNHSVVYWVSVLRAQLSQRSSLLILKLDIWKLQRRQFIFQEHAVQLRQITSPNLRVKGFVQATCLVGPRDRLVCYLLRHWEVRYCHTLRQVRVQFGYVARVPGLLQLFVDGVPPACTNLVKLQTYLALRSTSGKRLTCCTLGLMFWICFFCCTAFRCWFLRLRSPFATLSEYQDCPSWLVTRHLFDFKTARDFFKSSCCSFGILALQASSLAKRRRCAVKI